MLKNLLQKIGNNKKIPATNNQASSNNTITMLA
jgi:hypothetical protein